MELSKDYQQKIQTWLNALNLINLDDIVKKHKKVYEYIKNKYTNKNTLRGHLTVLGGVLNKMNKLPKISKGYITEAILLQKEIEKESKNQEMKPSRINNFVCFEDIEKRRDELKEAYEKNKIDNKMNLSHVLLSLYTLQPPIRMEYKDMPIVTKGSKEHFDLIKKNVNFLIDDNHKYYVAINNDKVMRTHGSTIFELNNELNKIIEDSLKSFPRKYILSLLSDGYKPLGKQGFERLLKGLFVPQNITIDLIRISYVTHMYSNKKINLNQKENLAKLMRSSREVGELHYNKLNVDCKNDPPFTQQDIIKEIPIVEQPKEKPKFNLRDWGKKYREQKKEEIKQKREERYENEKEKILRNKIVSNLNSGNTKKPRKDTMEKYNIVYDENLKRWI
jgi:hypothetical protein